MVPEVEIPTGDDEAVDQQSTAPSPSGDTEISPEEEAKLLGDVDADPADDVDMEVEYFSPPISPRQQ